MIISFICPRTRGYRVLEEFSRRTSERENLSFPSLSGFIYTILVSYKLLSKGVLLVTVSLVLVKSELLSIPIEFKVSLVLSPTILLSLSI